LTKHLVVFDVDSTLIEEEAIELLAEFSGTRLEVAEITTRAMAGEIDFSTSLIERVALLKGLDESVLLDVANSLTPTRGAKELIDLIHETDGYAALFPEDLFSYLIRSKSSWALILPKPTL